MMRRETARRRPTFLSWNWFSPCGEVMGYEDKLTQDLLEIITVFSAKLYRCRSQKNQQLINV